MTLRTITNGRLVEWEKIDNLPADTNAALAWKQATLVSATNIKTINWSSVLWSGDLVVGWGGNVDSVNWQTGVVVLDADDIDDTATTNKFVTATDITNLWNLSGTNTGDQTITLSWDVTGSGTTWITSTIAAGAVDIAMLSATGTPSWTTFLRWDNTWSVPAGAWNVSKVWTPVDNQIWVWTWDGTIEGDANLTFDTSTDTLTTVNTVLQTVKASGSGWVEIKNSWGTDVIVTGAWGGTGTSITWTTNVASASADYHQVAWGTGTITDTATGSSTNININLVPKGTGRLQANGVNVPTISSTDTLTNKRVTRRLVTTNAPWATPTTNTDNVDIMKFTGLAAAITSMTTNLSGTPVEGDKLEFIFLDDWTARAITRWASFAATTVPLPTTTVISTKLRVGFEWGGSTRDCIAVA